MELLLASQRKIVSMKNESKLGLKTQLQGQAGVWAAATQLALRGYVPFFPGVDFGYDILLDNGLRLQVKTARLFSSAGLRMRHPEGAYGFDTRSCKPDSNGKLKRQRRDYSKVADFFVLWGIDENRFWIVPCSELKGGAVIASRAKVYDGPQYAKVRQRNAQWEDNWDSLDVASVVKSVIEKSARQVLNLEEKI